MPELPEVELMCRYLRQELLTGEGRWKIETVRVLRDNGKYLPGAQASSLVTGGSSVTGVERRGKQLVFSLKKSGFLVCHNSMSGYWDMADRPWTFDYVEGKRVASSDDVRVEIRLSKSGPYHSSERTLRFHDSRLFGSLRFYDSDTGWPPAKSLQGLGPEALMTEGSERCPTRQLTADDLLRACQKKSGRTVKELLTDQSVVAGVGNIYAAEILWRAGAPPTALANSLTEKQASLLLDATVGELRSAIDRKVDYSDLRIYRRELCPLGHPVSMVRIAGRSSYFCPECQQ